MTPPGLQPERTTLAWSRTALSALAVAALMLRIGIARHDAATLAAAASAALTGAAALYGRLRRAPSVHPPQAMHRTTGAVTATICVIASCSTCLAVLLAAPAK